MQALLTTKDAAKYIGYGEQALALARMDGKLLGGIAPPKHTKIGGKTVRYKLTDLDAWIAALGE